MRTSHIEIRKRIDDFKSKISDEAFFTSRGFRGYLTDMAETSTNRYKRPLKIDLFWSKKKDAPVAYTNNHTITINVGNDITSSFPTRKLKADSIIGLNAHEMGHALYSNFEELSKYVESLKNGIFYPHIPANFTAIEQLRYDEMTKYFTKKPELFSVLASIGASLCNVIEDIYIESQMCFHFPGVYKTGILLNNARLLDNYLTIKQQIKATCKPFSIIMSLLIQYARSGDISNDDGYKGEYLEALDECLPYIDDTIYDKDTKVRFDGANHLLICLWPYVKQVLEEVEEEIKKGVSTHEATGTIMVVIKKQLGSSAEAPTGKSKPVTNRSKRAIGEQQKKNQKKMADKLKKQVEKSKGKDIYKKEEPKEEATARKSSKSSEQNTNEAIPFEDEISCQEVSPEEGGRIPHNETEDISDGEDGGIERNNEYEGSGYESSADDIERLLESMADEKVAEQLQDELCSTLQKESDGINYGNAHKGIKVNINRMTTIDEKLIENYNSIAKPLLYLSKRLQKQVSQVLKDKRDGGKNNGLLFGRRFDVRNVAHGDGRVFYNNRLPQAPMELAVAVLNDESGSMSCLDRVTMARAASIVIYDFCTALKLPIAIYGHTADISVELFAHAEFDSPDKNDKYRLMDISARYNNRDGAALRFVCERLLKRPEQVKLLILISDGQPAETGYYGSAAEIDLGIIKKEYERKGIKLFAAAIGDDRQNIERIYGDGFLDITDIHDLPLNLTSLITRHIKGR